MSVSFFSIPTHTKKLFFIPKLEVRNSQCCIKREPREANIILRFAPT